MGRKSTKENKSVYQVARENVGLTREGAEELCPALTCERINKLESGRAQVQPADILLMANCYRCPSLKNYYCANECPLGQDRVPEIHSKNLGQIAIETINALSKLYQERDRLLEIVEDGTVRSDEREDFFVIKELLDKLSVSVRTLNLWIEESMAQGGLPSDFLQE